MSMFLLVSFGLFHSTKHIEFCQELFLYNLINIVFVNSDCCVASIYASVVGS